MIIVKLYSCRRFLPKSQFCTRFIPQLAIVGKHFGRYDAVHDNDSVRSQHRQNLRHDVLQTASVATNTDGIRTGKFGDVRFEEVTDMYANAWRTKAAGILMDDRLALRTNLKSFYLKMREL